MRRVLKAPLVLGLCQTARSVERGSLRSSMSVEALHALCIGSVMSKGERHPCSCECHSGGSDA